MLLKIGKYAESEIVVSEANTALNVGSGNLIVFATPMLVALMENAAIKCIDGYLDKSFTTVGIALNIEHTKASLIGEKIVAKATLVEIKGRELLFNVEARDRSGIIGKGVHKRFIVDAEKFMNKLKAQKNID